MSSAISSIREKRQQGTESVNMKVETVTYGSLNGVKTSSDIGLCTPNLTRFQYRPKDFLNIHNFTPNLKLFQYGAKASTKKVLCDENVNLNQFISLSSTPAKLT